MSKHIQIRRTDATRRATRRTTLSTDAMEDSDDFRSFSRGSGDEDDDDVVVVAMTTR
jgi:hypothetical protein